MTLGMCSLRLHLRRMEKQLLGAAERWVKVKYNPSVLTG